MFNNYNLPLFYKIENGIEKSLLESVEKLSIKNILFLTDDLVYELYAKEYVDILIKNYNVEVEIIEENSISYSMILSEKIIENEIDLIIGMGGGRILDVCKYSSYISKISFISLPTIIANDGIASPIAVLKDKQGFTRSLGAKVPSGILIDLNIIEKAPLIFLKAGIGDILSNYTALFDWKISGDNVNDFAYLISKTAFNSIFYLKNKSLTDKSFLKKVCEAIILSGISMEIAGTSRPCSGAEHLFSHYIDRYYFKNNLHGLQVALGAVVVCYFQKRNFGELIKFLRDLEINISPRNLNISLEEFQTSWRNCKEMRKNRRTILDFLELKNQDYIDIYNELEEEFNK